MFRGSAAIGAIALLVVGCAADLDTKPPPRNAKAPTCPPPPEPALQSMVVGTIGKLHLVESRYPITRLGDAMVTFKPDLVLVAVRVDPFREGNLEDASFEMTYAASLAKMKGIPAEPIDWFRESELGAALPAVEPSDEVEIERREAEILSRPKLYTFEQANSVDLAERIFLAHDAQARHRAGNAPAARRTAWMQHLATDAVLRHGRPKKVLAYVDLLDRPAVDLALRAVGYEPKDPVIAVSKATEVMASELGPGVLQQYRAELSRARERADKAKAAAEKAFWEDRARVLAVVVDKRANCCVTQSAIGAK